MYKRQDWDREINTTDPEYYKWTQWIFLQLYKKGLAYKKEMNVNWCTGCKCVLANEEVVNGVCERCGSEVVHRVKSQWMLKILSLIHIFTPWIMVSSISPFPTMKTGSMVFALPRRMARCLLCLLYTSRCV